jgi:hypothetical protein
VLCLDILLAEYVHLAFNHLVDQFVLALGDLDDFFNQASA